MAKSARASSKKANKTRLRQKVFGPVEAARVARLSARLVSIANRKDDEMVDVAKELEGELEKWEEGERGGGGDTRLGRVRRGMNRTQGLRRATREGRGVEKDTGLWRAPRDEARWEGHPKLTDSRSRGPRGSRGPGGQGQG
jgi:hypothetical protein